MPGHISDHQPDCDLVAKPDTEPLRGWTCTCREQCGDCGRDCTCGVRDDRLAAFLAADDTRSRYTLTSTWASSGAFPSGDTLVQPFASLDEAINSGLHLSCCAGVRSVRVSEGDTVHCEYDRQDNIWNSRTPEARRYAKAGSASDDDSQRRPSPLARWMLRRSADGAAVTPHTKEHP